MFKLLILSILVTACNGGGDHGSNSKQTYNPETQRPEGPQESKELTYKIERSENLKSDLSNLEVFANNLNSYVIQIQALKGSFKQASVRCKTLGEEQKILNSNFDSEGKYALLTVTLDDSNLEPEEFHCVVNDQTQEYTKRFKIKKSLEIDLPTKIDYLKYDEFSTLNLDTLILRNGAGLYTLDKSLNISIKDLVAQNGKIGTFTPNATADSNTIGRDGGQIKLKVKNIYGQIDFELRGENGGVQKEVPEKKPGRPLTPSYLNGQCNEDNMENNKGRCEGKKGLTGEKGYTGHQGMEGGNTGNIELTVNSMSKAVASLHYFPGKGGRGGEGGEGGDGGLGGIGSRVRYYGDNDHGGPGAGGTHIKMMDDRSKTIKYPDGAVGEQGARGDVGESGLDGAIQSSIILDMENDLAIEVNKDWSNKGQAK